ncbi:MAG: hypothetical protein QM811_04300 [Pirellulales bacterium]
MSLAFGLFAPSPAQAADAPVDAKVVRMTLTPRAETRAASKPRLMYGFREQIDGNAVVYLGKVTAEEQLFFGNREIWQEIDRIEHAPIEELRGPKALYQVRQGGPDGPLIGVFPKEDHGPLYYLEQAAHCKSADWQVPIGREPFATMLLPELQQSRNFARLLNAQTRVRIATRRVRRGTALDPQHARFRKTRFRT